MSDGTVNFSQYQDGLKSYFLLDWLYCDKLKRLKKKTPEVYEGTNTFSHHFTEISLNSSNPDRKIASNLFSHLNACFWTVNFESKLDISQHNHTLEWNVLTYNIYHLTESWVFPWGSVFLFTWGAARLFISEKNVLLQGSSEKNSWRRRYIKSLSQSQVHW